MKRCVRCIRVLHSQCEQTHGVNDTTNIVCLCNKLLNLLFVMSQNITNNTITTRRKTPRLHNWYKHIQQCYIYMYISLIIYVTSIPFEVNTKTLQYGFYFES